MFWALVLSAIFCEVGEKMSNVWVEVNDGIEKIEWYFLPTKMQKAIIITMSFSQKSVVLDGFGSISGSREMFKKVRLFLMTYYTLQRCIFWNCLISFCYRLLTVQVRILWFCVDLDCKNLLRFLSRVHTTLTRRANNILMLLHMIFY